MAYDYSELVEKTKRWSEQALADGWIHAEAATMLREFDARTPENLFDHPASRPLIVAFMGGTGVGKSSLLNRLAGKAIAKSGIERPTSREVTLYHHQEIVLGKLPEKLPVEKIKLATHNDAAKKNIVWIDMPDFDSTEQTNKALVLEWLPHVDVLVYVVSPERYRDDKAWRLLLAEGNRHAWLFVLNQWDLGQTAQFEDFKQQLGKAGFADPIVFKTVCSGSTYPDDFAALESTISSLSNKHIVAELEQRSTQARKEELRHKLLIVRESLGSSSQYDKTRKLWQEQWQTAEQQLTQGLTWPIRKLAAFFAAHATDLVANPLTGNLPVEQTSAILWDDWAQTRFGDALDEFVAKADEVGLPVAPLKTSLVEVRKKAPKIVQAQTELHVRQALANPGNAVQRGLLKFVRLCEVILPLAAIGWVGYQVSLGYYVSNEKHLAYLGVDFAVHSGLLILMSWLIPWAVLKKVKPSLEASAIRGLNNGLAVALGALSMEVGVAVDKTSERQATQLRLIDELAGQCISETGITTSKLSQNSPLSRMLVKALS